MGKEKKNPITVLGPNLFKKHGIVDFNGLFSFIPHWLRTQGYGALEKGRSEKITSTGKAIESNWIAEKEVSDYVKYRVKINLFVRDLTDVAVERHGKTVKLQKGRVEIDFKSEMEKNIMINGRQRFNPDKDFHNFLKTIYEKYIIKPQLQALEDKLLAESQDFIKTMQSHLYP